MTLLLTVASVVVGVLLLGVLAAGLLLIVRPLHAVRAHLEHTATEVRAIETHLSEIPTATAELTQRLTPLGDELPRATARLDAAARTLAAWKSP